MTLTYIVSTDFSLFSIKVYISIRARGRERVESGGRNGRLGLRAPTIPYSTLSL